MHTTHCEACLVECAPAGSEVGAEGELRAQGAFAPLARCRRCRERAEPERTIADEADVSGECARAQRVSGVVESAEPADPVVLPAVGYRRRYERNAQWGGERDETRDRVRRDAGVEQRLGVGIEERRRLAERAIEVERDVVGERSANQLAVGAEAAARAAARRAE